MSIVKISKRSSRVNEKGLVDSHHVASSIVDQADHPEVTYMYKAEPSMRTLSTKGSISGSLAFAACTIKS